MRCGLACLLLVWGASLTAQAGVYQTPEPPPLAGDAKVYLARVDDVRTLARMQAKVEALKKEMGGAPTLDQRINLSALYLQLADYPSALEVLKEAEKIAPENFLVLGNLATAYQGMGDYFRAMTKLQLALKVWPRTYPNLSRKHLEWCWRAEQFQLEWLKAQYRNLVQGNTQPVDPMEAMFPGVKLFEPRGEYLVGTMSAKNRQALPPDALQILQQMVLWFPHDPHLFWNLGEMYNAHGDIETALAILKELVGERRKFTQPEMIRHRRELIDANSSLQAFANPEVRRGLFPLTEQPGINLAPVAYELSQIPVVPPVKTPAPDSPDSTAGLSATPRFDGWQPVAVAFLAGLIIGALVVFQVNEFRRWRAARRVSAPAS